MLPRNAHPAPTILYYLKTFHAVADQRSFTRAGARLHLSQPAVSAQIRALERHYGGPLFEVGNRQVRLTPEGEALLPYAERVLSLLREADGAVAATRGLERGRLVMAASTTIGNYMLPPLVRTFTRTYPGLEVEVLIGTTLQVAELVASERAPFGLVEASVDRDDLVAEPFGEDEIVLIAAPRDLPARCTRLTVDELRRINILVREPGSRTRVLIEAELHRAGLSLSNRTVLASTEAIKEGVLAGMGMAWVPRTAVAREIAAGELRVVEVDGIAITRTLCILRPLGRALRCASAAFVRMIRAGKETIA